MPPRHPSIARALGPVRAALHAADIGPGARVVVACSGGADSTALLGLLHLLAPGDRLALIVAHVDHGLRDASAAEAEAVAGLAARLGLQFCGARLQLGAGPGLPARAREARRAALRTIATRERAAAIALGHTATDQAETLLMHAARGCGLDGLAAMPEWDAPWLRPLLSRTRDETRALCERQGLRFVDDPTNVDRRHLRVRVREAVLPLLREAHPQVERALAGLAAQAREAEDALQAWAAREEVARRVPGAAARWSTGGLEDLPRAVRTRVLRRICERGGVDLEALRARVVDDIDRVLVARARALGGSLAVLRPHAWDLRPGVRLRLDRGGLALTPAAIVPQDGPQGG